MSLSYRSSILDFVPSKVYIAVLFSFIAHIDVRKFVLIILEI